MTHGMKRTFFFIAALTSATPLWAATWTVTTPLDNDPGATTCNTAHECNTLRDAIFSAQDNDYIVFALAGYTLPATITLDSAKGTLFIFGKNLTIDGPGAANLSISGGNATSVFNIGGLDSQPWTIDIENLTITGGRVIGTNGANGTTPGANGLPGGGAAGGCIFIGDTDTVVLSYDVVKGCFAVAGQGGNGVAGANGTTGSTGASGNGGHPTGYPGGSGSQGGTGGTGGAGGTTNGAAIYNTGYLIVRFTTVMNNLAIGGEGGTGGDGGTGGVGGYGGSGLAGSGGGPGGNGGSGGNSGGGGLGGSAYAGGIYTTGPVVMVNSTLADNDAVATFAIFGPPISGGNAGNPGFGGTFGNGGSGNPPGAQGMAGAMGVSGTGGEGGVGYGGGFAYNDTTQTTQTVLNLSTIAFNLAIDGPGGTPNGINGGDAFDGDAYFGSGGGFYGQVGGMQFSDTIVAGNTGSLGGFNGGGTGAQNCLSLLTDDYAGHNMEDATSVANCGFDLQAANTGLAPANGNGSHAYSWGGNGLPVVMPLAPSPALHVAMSNGDSSCNVAEDERGAARPPLAPVGQTQYCGLGAVQNDIIFRNGFEN